ncbi:MAG: prepilin peptidase [Planctomycetaceae bacterium]|nr:prepilin peptidase [Planctomycetaceae bacterium]
MQTELCVAIIFAAVAAITDVRSRRIPNWLTLTCFASGIAFHLRSAGTIGVWPVLSALEGATLAFAILIALWLINGAGAGDVKLGTAVGVWISTRETLYALLISFCICLIWKRLTAQSVHTAAQTFPASVAQPMDDPPAIYKIPYAVPLTASLVMLLIWSQF